MRDVSVGQGRQVQIPARLPVPIHDTDGNPLPAWARNKLPVGTVSVYYEFDICYYAINAAGKRITVPDENCDVNYIPTFNNIQPTHDYRGHRLPPNVAQRLPFGAYNIYFSFNDNAGYYFDINGIIRVF